MQRYEFDEIPIDIAGKPCGMFCGEYTLDGKTVDKVWVYSDTGWGPSARRDLIALHDLADPFSVALYRMLCVNIRSESSETTPRPVMHALRRPVIGGELLTT
jgi:hypothetical protein